MDQQNTEKQNFAQESKEESSDRLERYIEQGLEFIKTKNYEVASEHFKNRQVAESFGLFYEDGQVIGLKKTPSKESITRIADSVARNSWFWKDNPERTIELSDVYPIPPGNTSAEIPQDLKHEIALVYAEEWLHALQYMRGGPIAGQKDHEADVALYLKNHAVPLTETFIKRYPARSKLEDLQK